MLMVWRFTEQKPEPDSGDKVSGHSDKYLDMYLINEALTLASASALSLFCLLPCFRNFTYTFSDNLFVNLLNLVLRLSLFQLQFYQDIALGSTNHLAHIL